MGVEPAGHLSRRALLRHLVSATGLTVLAACAPAPPAAPPATQAPAPTAPPTAAPKPAATSAPTPAATTVAANTPTPAAKPAEQPRSGGTLRVAGPELFDLNPYRIATSNFDTLWACLDALTRYDGNLKPQPMLAESWDQSSDARQIKLSLRKGVQFHSGREFTSEDVTYSLSKVKQTGVSPQLAGMAAWWTSVETPDKYTVVLKSDQPRPLVFDMLEYLNIADRETLEGPDAKTKLVGTGPYVFVEWAQGDHIRFVKNKSYWQSGKPYLDELVFQISRDTQAAVVALEAGGLDGVLNPPVRETARLKKDPRFTVMVHQKTGISYLIAANLQVEPLGDKRVRQALNYAIDRRRFADTILQGIGEPRSLPWPAQSPAYEQAKDNTYTFDLEKAKSLLNQAGVSNGDIDITYISTELENAALAQVMASDYAKIGVTLNLKGVDSTTYTSLTNAPGKFRGLASRLSGFAAVEPVTMFTLGNYYRPTDNASNFTSEKYGQLIAQAGVEPDLAKRKQIYSQLNDILLDEAFIMPLAPDPPVLITKASVHGPVHSMHEAVLWNDVWMGA